MRSVSAVLLAAASAVALNNGLGRTPQMGSNSWNHYHCAVNETVMRNTADAFIKNGLDKLGYNYVNVDDCWAGPRDSNGKITADTKTFPSGMASLAAYIHSKGLKAGLYTDLGSRTCAGRPGSLGYETKDAESYATWDYDYVKVDNCNAPSGDKPETRYPVMRDALNATGRKIFFSMCEWGVDDPWLWSAAVGNSWRTTGDISDSWSSMTSRLDLNEPLWPYAGPGGWNDPDMLEVGNGGMTTDEYTAHFTLWAMSKAPLLIGCDVGNMDANTTAILTNTEIIALNQDPAGVQARRVASSGTPTGDDGEPLAARPAHPGHATKDEAALAALVGLGATNIVAQPCDASRPAWQSWAVSGTRITSAADGRCVDIDECSESTTDLNNLSVYPCHDDAPRGGLRGDCAGKNEMWTVDASTGAVTSALDGQCITAADTATTRNPGAVAASAHAYNVGTLPCASPLGPDQSWTFDNATGRIVSAIKDASGADMCLSVFQDVAPGAQEVWAGALDGGAVALALFNRGASSATIKASLVDAGIPDGTTVSVRDLWAHKDMGTATGSLQADVNSHGIRAFKLTPQSH